MIEMKNVDQALGDDLERVSIQLEKATEIELVAKEELKDAKATTDSLKKRETELVIEMRSGQQRLDFTDDSDDAWKTVTLLELGITGKEAEILTDAKLTTLGKIAAYTSSGKELTDLAGIGTEKADAMSQKMEHYWATHPQSPAEPLLEWTEGTDCDELYYTATSQYSDDRGNFKYRIEKIIQKDCNGDLYWHYELSDDPLFLGVAGRNYSHLEEAKANAERVERDLIDGTNETTKGN